MPVITQDSRHSSSDPPPRRTSSAGPFVMSVASVVSPSNPHPVQQSAPPPPSTDTNHHHHHVFSPSRTLGADQHSNRAIHSYPTTAPPAPSSEEGKTKRRRQTPHTHRPTDRRHHITKITCDLPLVNIITG